MALGPPPFHALPVRVGGPVIRTILLATDLTGASDEATAMAVDLARRLAARLIIFNVLEKRRLTGVGAHDRVDQARAEREARLMILVKHARDVGASAEFLLWTGDPGASISAAAEAEGADVVVVGTRGRSGAGRMLLGSVSDHVVRTADCPVLVARPTSLHAAHR